MIDSGLYVRGREIILYYYAFKAEHLTQRKIQLLILIVD